MDRLSEWIDAFRAATKDGDPVRPDPCGMPELIGFLEELRSAREELAERWSQLQLLNAELGTAREELATAQRKCWLSERARRRHEQQLHEALEEQAAVWVRAAELTPAAVPLEQLLALVPERYALASRQTDTGYLAWWHLGQAGILAESYGLTVTGAVRTATIALLRGRQRCGTCAHWGAEDETGHVRSCRTDEDLSYTAESSCSDGWAPAKWLEPEPSGSELRRRRGQLPVSPGRLVRAALAWADERAADGVSRRSTDRELIAAANELRGIGPEPNDGEGGASCPT